MVLSPLDALVSVLAMYWPTGHKDSQPAFLGAVLGLAPDSDSGSSSGSENSFGVAEAVKPAAGAADNSAAGSAAAGEPAEGAADSVAQSCFDCCHPAFAYRWPQSLYCKSYSQIWWMAVRRQSCLIDRLPAPHPETGRCSRPAPAC